MSEQEQETALDIFSKWGNALNTLKGIMGGFLAITVFLVIQYLQIQANAIAVQDVNKRLDALQAERKIAIEANNNWKESKAALDATQTEAINSLKDAIQDLRRK